MSLKFWRFCLPVRYVTKVDDKNICRSFGAPAGLAGFFP